MDRSWFLIFEGYFRVSRLRHGQIPKTENRLFAKVAIICLVKLAVSIYG